MKEVKNDDLTVNEQRALDIWDSEDDPSEHTYAIKGELDHPPEKGGIWKLFRTQDP